MARVCVVGAGAIGGVVAARMAAGGHQVCVVARGSHLQAIRAQGLRLEDRTPGGQRITKQVRASHHAEDFGEQDLVVLGLKGHAIAAMLPSLRPLMGPQTIVVPAMNGLPWWYFHRDGSPNEGMRVACLDPNASMFGDLDSDRIIGCVVHVAAEVTEPGLIAQTAPSKMIIGEPSGKFTARLERLAAWWRESEIEVIVSSSIRHEIWIKLIGNLSFNPVAALTGYRMDQIVADDGLLDVIRPMIDESKRVAAAYGIGIAMSTEARIDMARKIGRTRLSTLQDFEAGRRPEIEGLMGSVIELADRAKVPVPTIRNMAALLTARARHLGLVAAPATPD
jgi:2-dehydropantoate 2-reductase